MALTGDVTNCTVEEYIARLREKLSKLPSVCATGKRGERMTDNRETIEMLKMLKAQALKSCNDTAVLEVKIDSFNFVLDEAIKTLEQQPCDDCISRQVVLDGLASIAKVKARSDAQKSLMGRIMFFVEQLSSVTPKEKTKRCKDCKWWKDNDGVYRRGVNAESNCPINARTVYEGNG